MYSDDSMQKISEVDTYPDDNERVDTTYTTTTADMKST